MGSSGSAQLGCLCAAHPGAEYASLHFQLGASGPHTPCHAAALGRIVIHSWILIPRYGPDTLHSLSGAN